MCVETSFSVCRVGASFAALRGAGHADVLRAGRLLEDMEHLAAHLGRDVVSHHFYRGPADEDAERRPAERIEPSDDSATPFIEKSELVLLRGDGRCSAVMRTEMDERGIREKGIVGD